MLIDWFTMAAQVINFMILLVLLKIFLFDKIKTAMDQREKNIQQRFDSADEQKKEAQNLLEEYKTKIRQFNEQRDAKLEKAQKEAKEQKDSLIKEAKKEVDQLKKSWQNALEEQKVSFFQRFRSQAATLIFDTVKKTLLLVADSDVQEKAVKKFLNHLKDLEADTLPKAPGSAPLVTSGFELSRDQKKSIEQAFVEKFEIFDSKAVEESEKVTPFRMVFEVKPELILGIALFAGDKKITWHARDYLESLEKKLNKTIEGRENE